MMAARWRTGEVPTPADEVRELSDADVVKALDEAYHELFNLRMRHATRQLTTDQALPRARKRIARIKTIQAERRLGITRG
jgi:large subunit ribosomal protein L29